MTAFYRSGRLISNDTVKIIGKRTLAGATREDLWSGTAVTRPVPGGVQIEAVSSSTEDDSVKTQSGTIIIAGTMDPITTDEWNCVAAGGINNGDICRLTLNGVHYDTMINPAIASLAALVTEVAATATSGSFDIWSVTTGGVLDAGDIITVTVPGATASPYAYTVIAADTPAIVASGLKAIIDADGGATYIAAVSGNTLILKKSARGTGVTITGVWTTDPGVNATVTVAHTVTGQASQSAWTVTSNGVTNVRCLHATAGVTADTVASSFTVDGGAASTFVATHTFTGANADILAVNNGTTTYSRTVLTAVLADEVAALASSINGAAAYVASSVAGTITVSAAVPGVGFTFANASTDNQTADLTVTINNTANMANGAGTGLQTLLVSYLDGDGVRQSETLTMNGITAVASVAVDVEQILGVSATSVGTNGSAVGTVTIRVAGGGTTLDVIAVGDCQTFAADYTVPVRQKAFVAMTIQSVSVASVITLLSDTNPATGALVSGAAFTWASLHAGPQHSEVDPAIAFGPFPAGSRVWITCTGAAARVALAQADVYLEPAQ